MATRALMAELFQQWTEQHTPGATLQSVGGVEALRRLRAGEAFDGARADQQVACAQAGQGVLDCWIPAV